MSIRVRFAPSPTGLLHVGALRTALYDDLLARGNSGTTILRIEDTDQTRYSADSEQEFIDTLKWVGIEFDEGPHIGGPNAPYRQSERKAAGIYEPYIQELLTKKAAYRAFDTPEELDEMRTIQQINKQPTGYFGGAWRDATEDQVEAAAAAGKPSVVRLRIPRGEKIAIDDAVRGRIEWDSDTIDDPVLIKADGMPTYHFAAMVDDHLMQITHVVRGEEWISSAPKHAALYDAFGWERPIFVHCSVILGSDGKKLSKRHGATRVLDYAAQGFMKGPLKNFIALIGWSPGDDREVMSQDELVEAFRLTGLQQSPGKFDIEKLKWMNGVGIRALTPAQLLAELSAYLAHPYTEEFLTAPDLETDEPADLKDKAERRLQWAGLAKLAEQLNHNQAYALSAMMLEQERVQTLAEFGPACSFFFGDEVDFDSKATEKWFAAPHVRALLEHFVFALQGRENIAVEECDALVRQWAEANGYEKIGPVVHPTRVALTGRTFGPGLFELMSLLGPDRMTKRFRAAMEILPS